MKVKLYALDWNDEDTGLRAMAGVVLSDDRLSTFRANWRAISDGAIETLPKRAPTRNAQMEVALADLIAVHTVGIASVAIKRSNSSETVPQQTSFQPCQIDEILTDLICSSTSKLLGSLGPGSGLGLVRGEAVRGGRSRYRVIKLMDRAPSAEASPGEKLLPASYLETAFQAAELLMECLRPFWRSESGRFATVPYAARILSEVVGIHEIWHEREVRHLADAKFGSDCRDQH